MACSTTARTFGAWPPGFVLSSHATGICTAGDVRLLPLFVEAEKRRGSRTSEDVEAELSHIPELEPPFVRVEGREVPEWLEPLLPNP